METVLTVLAVSYLKELRITRLWPIRAHLTKRMAVYITGLIAIGLVVGKNVGNYAIQRGHNDGAEQ